MRELHADVVVDVAVDHTRTLPRPCDVPSLWLEVGPRRRNRSRRRVRWQRAKFIVVGLRVGESLDAVVWRGV